MISRHTSSIPKEDVVFPKLVYSDFRCSQASPQRSQVLPGLSWGNIGQAVFVNMIASMNLFTISNVAFWCWGMFWSPLALGCGTFWSPLYLQGGRAWADSERSDPDHLLKRVDFLHLSRGGAIAPAEFRELKAEGVKWHYRHVSVLFEAEPS